MGVVGVSNWMASKSQWVELFSVKLSGRRVMSWLRARSRKWCQREVGSGGREGSGALWAAARRQRTSWVLITSALVVARESRQRLRMWGSSGVRGLSVAKAGREGGGLEMRVLARRRVDLDSVGNRRWEYREGVAGKS